MPCIVLGLWGDVQVAEDDLRLETDDRSPERVTRIWKGIGSPPAEGEMVGAGT